jgi:parallel beta-helix repeat protein
VDLPVADVAALTAAVSSAQPGDRIVLAAGTYAFPSGGRAFTASTKGTADKPITVVAATPLAAKLELGTLEGIVVEGPFWRFEGLDIRGVCPNDADCEHAFHVVGGATDVVLRGNRLVDFNAQLKVNATGPTAIPHRGLVERNEIYDTHGRKTDSPVTKLNIDTGDDWIVRDNVVRDFFKDGGNGISYGVFLKSGGHRGLLERNLVLCERDVVGGTRIGLSFGGGGTGPQYCAPAFDANVPCDVEHEDGVMKNNVVASCSDVGIYLNRAKNTRLLHNTLLGTVGIDYRFATTTGAAEGNLLVGRIKDRDGGTHTEAANLVLDAAAAAALYQDGAKGDLRKKGSLDALLGKNPASPLVTDDYCGRARGAGPLDIGALESSLGDCVTTTPGGSTGAGAGGSAGAVGAGGNAGMPGGGGAAGAAPAGGGSVAGAAGTSVGGAAGRTGTAGTSGGGNGGAALAPAAGGDADEGGCGCRVAGSATERQGATSGLAALVLAAALWSARAARAPGRRTGK